MKLYQLLSVANADVLVVAYDADGESLALGYYDNPVWDEYEDYEVEDLWIDEDGCLCVHLV